MAAADTQRSRDPAILLSPPMQITEFIRDSETFSIGAAAGKGRHYRCAVANATGRIEYLEELTGGCRRPDVTANMPKPPHHRIAGHSAYFDDRWQ